MGNHGKGIVEGTEKGSTCPVRDIFAFCLLLVLSVVAFDELITST